MSSPDVGDSVIRSQLDSLDDTDCYSTAWEEALANTSNLVVRWGGRGQGGRGTSRRTFQPKDVVVDDVRLEYVGNETAGSAKLMLDGAVLKLLSGRVYGLIGNNGCGKSSLLKRIHAGKIPGFPPHVSTYLVPQTLATQSLDTKDMTPLSFLLDQYEKHSTTASQGIRREIDRLEEELEGIDISALEEDGDETGLIEDLGEQIGRLESQLEETHQDAEVKKDAQDALAFMGVPEHLWDSVSLSTLSPGLQKKIALASALVCRCDLLLLDEPTSYLDVPGLLQLRRLLTIIVQQSNQERVTTVVLVSHDRDLVNDVCSDIIVFETNQKDKHLAYYPGNYDDYSYYRRQNKLHQLRQVVALNKKRGAMMETLDKLKKQPTPKRGGSTKKAKQIKTFKKKIEREGVTRDENGHRWSQQKMGTGIRVGAINSLDAATRRGLKTEELLKMTEKSIRPPPDKAIQFVFRNPTSEWGEPLVQALDIGHGFEVMQSSVASKTIDEGFLFDCVDLSIEEGKRYCILGENGCGKTVLLKLLAGIEEPVRGSIKHALGVDVSFLDSQTVDDGSQDAAESVLSFLLRHFPSKTEKEIRGELTSFGLSPSQALTSLLYLSGGERRRLAFVMTMLRDPQVLVIDEATQDLDIESTEALVDGLRDWRGTLVFSSHDASFIRSLDAECYVLLDKRLQRVEGGIDQYLRAYQKKGN